ncbi:MAG: hypothetical protein COT71_03195 [Candidatus Andersenbacteria bacterium CG10_big_fil_rev_8_21_14_0_10_54_11]|uniref:Uncharacterized protein n=1 Tax=Candidatus Andersenbacteria bacterium CG10_big_fil_rev_8_21_14_0_10_54_11 TaxID=1974485 RepID=A0A2M6WYQ4_9BACT|nr:MAG: hypothetical protein COT71_03195 [Candidatus Andersenbacteria bacterium CG10_big_fil_rev_8_21_14_0_10_54_11]
MSASTYAVVRDCWTGRVGAGIVGGLPDDFDSACAEARRRAECLAPRVFDIDFTPEQLATAYSFLRKEFAGDPRAKGELKRLTIEEIFQRWAGIDP